MLTGAGCSTESGIPDYRGPEGSLRNRTPVQYGEFIRRPDARTRYWARSAVGWPRFSASRPNPAHRALARLEEEGVVRGVITQNVDGLHHAAGSRRVVELHGSLSAVRCLECGSRTSRGELQDRILELNPDWPRLTEDGGRRATVESAPDGDAEVPAEAARGFRIPACEACGGILKPDVVFFGENVPKERVQEAWRLFEEGDVLLVAGSSLQVYSGRRFIHRADRDGVPVAIVNLGPTRADDSAVVKVEGKVGRVLPRVAGELLNGAPGPDRLQGAEVRGEGSLLTSRARA